METSPYSEDLRKKVIQYLELGKRQRSATEVFELNISTVSRCWLRYQREGHCKARLRSGKKPRVTLEEVERYIESNPNFRSCDMGKHFGMTIYQPPRNKYHRFIRLQTKIDSVQLAHSHG
jgi:transposase